VKLALALVALLGASATGAQPPAKVFRLCPGGTTDTTKWVEPDTASAPYLSLASEVSGFENWGTAFAILSSVKLRR
jgi:hypothetical protein